MTFVGNHVINLSITCADILTNGDVIGKIFTDGKVGEARNISAVRQQQPKRVLPSLPVAYLFISSPARVSLCV